MIVHCCGHIISNKPDARFPSAMETAVATRVNQLLEQQKVSIAFGSLAAGADLLIAEKVLAQGGKYHAVLPFASEEFQKASVNQSGANWNSRYHQVLQQASSITQVYTHQSYQQVQAFALCTRVAIGLTVFVASVKETKAVQMCIWDEQTTNNEAGTYADMRRWKKFQLTNIAISAKTAQPIAINSIDSLLDNPLVFVEISFSQGSIFPDKTTTQEKLMLARLVDCQLVEASDNRELKTVLKIDSASQCERLVLFMQECIIHKVYCRFDLDTQEFGPLGLSIQANQHSNLISKRLLGLLSFYFDDSLDIMKKIIALEKLSSEMILLNW